MDPVTEALHGRLQPDGGIQRMMGLSLAAHVVALAALVLVASVWRGAQTVTREVMTISLGGSAGPEIGGLTPIAGRPVQQVVTEPPTRPQATRAPAAPVPEMTVPAAAARPRPAAPRDAPAPRTPTSRTPTTGPELQPGTAAAETSGRGEGFGLSSGGGRGIGSTLEVGNFCCPEYLSTMQALIRRNWNERQSASGDVLVRFAIRRDGTIEGVDLERSSGSSALDLESQRALALTRQLPPLPAAFPDARLVVHLAFRYTR